MEENEKTTKKTAVSDNERASKETLDSDEDGEVKCLHCNDTGFVEQYDSTDFGDWEVVNTVPCECLIK